MDTTIGYLGLPESWKFYASTLGAMIVLAGLDFVGSLFAKEWAERGRIPMFMLGWLCFSALYVVYARILKVAELSTVTIGWIVFLQVGLLLLDRIHYNVQMPAGKWAAIAVILVLQVYLVAAPNNEPEPVSEAHYPASSELEPTEMLQAAEPAQVLLTYGEQGSVTEGALSRPGRPLGPGGF